jgi:hypothetical protein
MSMTAGTRLVFFPPILRDRRHPAVHFKLQTALSHYDDVSIYYFALELINTLCVTKIFIGVAHQMETGCKPEIIWV